MSTPTAPGRVELTGMVAMIMATGALGIDLMLPAFGSIRSDFGLAPDSTAVAGIITAYLVGMALGQLLFGALSDRYGRKRALVSGLILYAAAAVAAALSPTLPFLLGARFVWGFAASGPRVVAVAVIRDMFEGDRMAQVMSFTMAVFIMVPIIAPTLGSAVLEAAGWRWVFGVCVVFAVAMVVWTVRLPETLRPEHRRPLRLRPFLEAAREVVSNRSTMAATVAMTLLFGAFSSYLASSELIIGEIIGRRELFPILFGALAAVMGLAMVGNGALVGRFGVARMSRWGLIAYAAWTSVVAGVGWFSTDTPGVFAYLAAMAPILALHALVFPNLNTVAMQPMGSIAGTASAIIGTISTALGALIGSLIDSSVHGSVVPLTVGFAVCGVAALAVSALARPVTVAA